jgi:hypothetical protein
VKSLVPERLVLFGHSLGSLCSACGLLNGNRVDTILTGALTGRSTSTGRLPSPRADARPGETGRLTTDGKGEVQRKVVVDAQMLKDFEEIDQYSWPPSSAPS